MFILVELVQQILLSVKDLIKTGVSDFFCCFSTVSINASCQNAKISASTYSTTSSTLTSKTVYLAEMAITCENDLVSTFFGLSFLLESYLDYNLDLGSVGKCFS